MTLSVGDIQNINPRTRTCMHGWVVTCPTTYKTATTLPFLFISLSLSLSLSLLVPLTPVMEEWQKLTDA
jgi:hypothetical protein